MLPDMADAFDEWLSDYTVLTVTRATANFARADAVVGRTVQAMVQPARKQRLNPAQVDWSKRYKLVHSPEQLVVGEYIEIDGEDYKIIDDGDYQAYGYTEAIAEQTKQTKLVVTV
jgi:hypothetical protein